MHESDPPVSPVWDGLLRDIDSGCRRCAAAIEKLVHPELEPHRRRAVETLSEIEAAVEEALEQQATSAVDLALLGALGGELDIFRRAHLPFFAHYGSDERYLTLLARHLADEAGFTIHRPILGTFSSAGYWTNPSLSTICLPSGDHAQVLALPDLVHELAHLLLHETEAGLRQRLLSDSIGPYANGLGPVDGDAEFASRLYYKYWDWATELIADATAAFVCGPSYGWQHIRLCAQSSGEAGQAWLPAAPPGPAQSAERFTHPADSARMSVIATVLSETGQQAGADRLQDEWAALTAHAGAAPATYTVSYPASVLHDVATMTLEWCRAKELVAFADAEDDAIVRHVDRAWTQQLANPVIFAQSEAKRVSELRAVIESAPGS